MSVPPCATPGLTRYKNHRCRCDECRAAAAAYQREYTHRVGLHRPRAVYLAERYPEPPPHGTEIRYQHPHRCRCDECRAAAAAARRERRARARERATHDA